MHWAIAKDKKMKQKNNQTTTKIPNQPTKQKLLWKRRLLNTWRCKPKDLLVRL